ncbi:glycosyltransferase [Kineococcus glutinatus]|uniref:Glycosyltransferase family 4 protein n=1 Tax=Kineococcus glutinatus TaxID=1070872 RepID=A0ABP9H311_9ACTN
MRPATTGPAAGGTGRAAEGGRALRVFVTHPGASLYGSDRMLLEAVRGMAAAGLEPVLCVPGPGPLVDEVASWGVPVEICPVPVLRKSALSPRGALRLLGTSARSLLRGAAALRRTRPDVVYVSTVTTPSWVLLARAMGLPVVCHVHEAESGVRPAVQRVLTSPLLAASTLLVNSRFALEVLLRSWPQLSGRAGVVLNGVAGPPAGTPAPRRPGEPARVLYVGRLSERKGVLVALEAVESLVRSGADVHLDLVGDVFAEHAEFADRLRERTRALERAGRVTLHGFEDDVWPHLASCDVLVVPSVLPEPFGNTAVEGVLAGRPVVASDIGGLPEALEGYRSARLVPAGDATALALAIRDVVADLPDLAVLAVQDARAAAERHAPRGFQRAVVEQLLAVAR